MAGLDVNALAEQDIVEILACTEERFGSIARTRYQTLITTALRDLERDPLLIGSRPRPELGASIRTYHLRHSRARAQSPADGSRRRGTSSSTSFLIRTRS